MYSKILRALGAVTLSAVLATVAAADFDSGSTGADGAFNPGSDITINLATEGTYDPVGWAVVFNYTDIDIPVGVTVTFSNHPSGAPVVWLASGDVIISGTVDVSGADGVDNSMGEFSVPGPGGFAGARAAIDPVISPATAGFGPGGAPFTTSTFGAPGAGYATPGGEGQDTTDVGGPTYGNIEILPLIGGSGGSTPNITTKQGGPGGGAILIASSGEIVLDLGGLIAAHGGDGGGAISTTGGSGSGGAIRLLADKVSGKGLLRAKGGQKPGFQSGAGGDGRIRVEADSIDVTDPGNPAATFDLSPGPIFPDASAPTLTATMVMGDIVPADPLAGIETTDMVVADTAEVTIEIEATNIPVGTLVEVVLVPDGGPGQVILSTPLAGDLSLSTATAQALLATGIKTEIFLRADFGTSKVTGRGGLGQ
jgi:hypothetical protein